MNKRKQTICVRSRCVQKLRADKNEQRKQTNRSSQPKQVMIFDLDQCRETVKSVA
jgi:hypothetical protein